MAAEPPGGDDARGAEPPFLSWPAIYLVVLGALVAEIVLGALLSARFR